MGPPGQRLWRDSLKSILCMTRSPRLVSLKIRFPVLSVYPCIPCSHSSRCIIWLVLVDVEYLKAAVRGRRRRP